MFLENKMQLLFFRYSNGKYVILDYIRYRGNHLHIYIWVREWELGGPAKWESPLVPKYLILYADISP